MALKFFGLLSRIVATAPSRSNRMFWKSIGVPRVSFRPSPPGRAVLSLGLRLWDAGGTISLPSLRVYFAYISRSLTLLILPTLVLGISATIS